MDGRPWARSSSHRFLLTSPPNPTNYHPAGDTPLKQFPHKSRQHPGPRIAALYRIEADIRGKDAAHRLAVRQAKSQALVADLRTWFQAKVATLPARGPTAVAIGYALKHWDGLERFLDDGRIELDTNTVERAMRPVALSRKNALFAGSDEGAANWAVIASLVETCKLNGVEPQRYLTEVLTRLVNGWSKTRIDELMPWNWATPASR